MIQACIAVLAICVLAAMSMRANRRFKDVDRLPMQWSPSGSVNWTAPRVIALTFTPVLAAITLSATVVLTIFAEPKPGQEGFEAPTVMFIAAVFIGAHAFHLRLIAKSLRGNS